MVRWTAFYAVACGFLSTAGYAELQVDEAKASFAFNGVRVEITRNNPDMARFSKVFTGAGAGCGTPCINPMQAAQGVQTIGETEVLGFLVDEVGGNRGLMVDARMPADRAKGHIPGSVSLPHAALVTDTGFKADILTALGAREMDGVFNFADARALLVYDNGPSTEDAEILVRGLLSAGYPPEKIQYYRGGMLAWSMLGFSIYEGDT